MVFWDTLDSLETSTECLILPLRDLLESSVEGRGRKQDWSEDKLSYNEAPTEVSASGASKELRWPFSWGKGSGPFYPSSEQPLDAGLPLAGKLTLGETPFRKHLSSGGIRSSS